MKYGTLKILPEFFEEIINYRKRAELRYNDRNFRVGDKYTLREYDGTNYTGRSVKVVITYVLTEYVGLAEGYCMFSFDIEDISWKIPTEVWR